MQKARLLREHQCDTIEVDLSELIASPGLDQELLLDRVLRSAPRQWICAARHDVAVAGLQAELDAEVARANEEFRRRNLEKQRQEREARAVQKRERQEWREAHREYLGFIQQYGILGNRIKVESILSRRLSGHDVYMGLRQAHGDTPKIVDIPVHGELAFNAHRVVWQTLIFNEFILSLHQEISQQVEQWKKHNLRHYYGLENTWLAHLQHFSPATVYKKLRDLLPLSRIASQTEQLAEEPILVEAYKRRPDALIHLTAHEYKLIPKPIPAIRRYLNVLTELRILEAQGGTFCMPYQAAPAITQPVGNYHAIAKKGLRQYGRGGE